MIKGELFDINSIDSLGIIGDFAFNCRGQNFYIGDIVKIREYNNSEKIIIRRRNRGNAFVSGHRDSSDTEYKRNNITIIKTKSYKELQNGKVCHYAIARIEYKNENRRIMEEIK
jgi:hypothetical protein